MSLEKDLNKNVLYSCCNSPVWIDVINNLNQDFNLKPSYFIGKEDSFDKIRDINSSCFFQTVKDAWKGIGFPLEKYNYPLDEDFIKQISFEELISLKMMDRLDLDRHSFSLSQREDFFYDLLRKWIVIVKEYNIDLVISSSIPHRVFDYVLYIVCKFLNIKFVMFQMTPFSDSSFIIDDISRTSDLLKKYIDEKTDVDDLILRRDIEERIKRVEGHYHNAIPDYMIKQKNSLSKKVFVYQVLQNLQKVIKNPKIFFKEHESYYVQKGKMPKDSKMSKLSFYRYKFQNRIYLNNLYREYTNMCEDIDIKKIKYIFVALHYQPEETSNPTGGVFVNQKLIIELLDTVLDKDIIIIVKEHKTQFHPSFEGATSRNINFYKDLINISQRVKLVDINTDPFELIDNALATVTISGTVGWESVIRGTPSLIFGRAWYENMVGVFKVKSKKELNQALSEITDNKYRINIKDIYDYHKKLQHFLIEAPHYSAFEGKVERNMETNVQNLFSGLVQYLKQKGLVDE